MDFNDYQVQSRRTAIYPDIGRNFVYPTLGLASEAGEVAGKVKKIFRDFGGTVDEDRKKEITKELGDVLWYVAQVATEFGMTLDDIARLNIENLAARQERGTLHGNGDNR